MPLKSFVRLMRGFYQVSELFIEASAAKAAPEPPLRAQRSNRAAVEGGIASSLRSSR